MANRKLIWLYLWVFFLSVVQASFGTLLSPYLGTVLNLSDAAIGGVVSSIAVVALISRLPIGEVYRPDRAVLMLTLGTLTAGLAIAAFGGTASGVSAIAIGAVWGVGWAVATTTHLALVLQWKARETSRMVAVSWYAALAGVGHASSGLSGLLADRIGFRLAFIVLGGVLVLSAASSGVAMWFEAFRSDPVPQVVLQPNRSKDIKKLMRFRGLAPAVWVGVLLGFQMNVVTGMVKTFQPVLSLAVGMTLTEIGILHGLTGAGSAAVRIGSGLTFGRFNFRAERLNTPLVVAGVVAAAIIPSVKSSFGWQVPLFVTLGVSRGLLRASSTASAFEPSSGEEAHGRIAALLHSGLDLGRVAGPALAGIIASIIGLDVVFVVLPTALLAGYLLLSHAVHRHTSSTAT